jgi:AcrR family transcriptional regulator
MPRGVTIPEVRERLFAAAEQVIARDGPAGLSSRAITGEAGVATGVLYTHFADMDGFLAGYAVNRTFQIASEIAALPARAGTGTVVGNLTAAAVATSSTTLLPLARLMAAHPHLAARVRAVLGDTATGLDAIQRATAAYLAAEQRLGRVPESADTDALAIAVVGVIHHLALTGEATAVAHTWIRRVVTALLSSAHAEDASGAPGE